MSSSAPARRASGWSAADRCRAIIAILARRPAARNGQDGVRAEDTPFEERRAEGHRVAAVAVGEFRHEDEVALEQGRDHRARRNVEGLEEERADHHRDQQRERDGLDGLEEAVLFLGLALLLKAHHVGPFTASAPAGRSGSLGTRPIVHRRQNSSAGIGITVPPPRPGACPGPPLLARTMPNPPRLGKPGPGAAPR